GSDAILNDMTLLSVGTAAANSAPSNTSLGRIGVGYVYTDFQPQISFTSVKFGGFSVGAGIFQPLTTIGSTEVNSQPGFQGKLTYDFAASGVTGHLWGGVISQKHDATGSQSAYTGTGYEAGAKFGYGPVGLLG
ncbi:porin, partial [bacterium]|nr:porin [bacterium]